MDATTAKDADCLQADKQGLCMPSPAPSGKKWCVFPAASCVSGQAWGGLAGGGLAASCVAAASGPDGGVDGPDAGIALLAADEPAFDFGAVPPGEPTMHTFTLRNKGGASTGSVSILVTGGE